MKIFVTGATGFIGRRLALRLFEDGHDLVVLSRDGEVFKFFSQARNLETITPPWLHFKIITQTEETLHAGSEIVYRLRVHGLPLRGKTRIEDWQEDHAFADEQLKGPYAKWHHVHRFESIRGGTLLRERVSYRLPLGQLGALVGGRYVEQALRKIFSFSCRSGEGAPPLFTQYFDPTSEVDRVGA